MYVRIRSRVRGPYKKDVLVRMSKTGQLARSHEVSIDGVDWQPASDFPELFLDRGSVPKSIDRVQPVERGSPVVEDQGPPPLDARSEMSSQNAGMSGSGSGATAAQDHLAAGIMSRDHPPGSGGPASSFVGPGIKEVGSDPSVRPTPGSSDHDGTRTVQGKSRNNVGLQKKRKKRVNPIKELIFIIVGALLAVPTAQVILWQLGKDPLNLAPSFRDVGFPEFLLAEPEED